MPKVYGGAQLWGIVAITAGVSGLVVGGAVFVYMLVRSNDLDVQIKTLQQQLEQVSQQEQLPNGTQRSPTGTGLPTTQAEDGTKTTTVPVNGGLAISYPGIQSIYVMDEPDRRGAFYTLGFSLDIQTLVAATQLSEVGFFNADSVAAFDQQCAQPNTLCSLSGYPTPESFFQEFRSLTSGVNGTDGELLQFNGINWIVRTEAVGVAEGFIRKYASFFGETRVEFTIWMPDQADAAGADALFEQVTIGPPTA